MGPRARSFLIPLAALVLFLPSAAAWHWDDEEPLERHGSRAGDIRTLDDAGDCITTVSATSGVVCSVLYGHVLDLLSGNPLNAQRPADCTPDIARGFTGAPGVEPYWTFNRLLFALNSNLVAYDPERCDETPRSSMARDHLADIRISDAAPITGYVYLSADTLEFSPFGIGTGTEGPLPSAGAIPCLTVRMTVEAGRFVGAGTVLATGETTKTILSTPESAGGPVNGLPDGCPGAQGTIRAEAVTEFVVDLGAIESTVVGAAGLIVYAEWMQWDAGDDQGTRVVQQHWNVHSGGEHRTRIVVPLEPSLSIGPLVLQELNGALYVGTQVYGPFGTYDVDVANLRVTLVAPDGTETRLAMDPHLRYAVAGDGSSDPLRVSYTWDYHGARLAPGPYALHLSATNWQHSQVAERAAEIWIASAGTWGPVAAQTAPEPSLEWAPEEITVLLILALAAVGLVYLSASVGTRRGGP